MNKWLREALKPKPINWKQTLYTFAVVGLSVFGGFVTGFYAGTGTLPIPTGEEGIAPPEVIKTTIVEVQDTLSEEDLPEYQEGYNCVDFAWDAMRQLAWKGQPAAIIRVDFETGPSHALLLVPTADEGWVFIEPQAGLVVKPSIGGVYNDLFEGRRIIAFEVLTMEWVPYDEFVQDPVFEEVIDE